ncbi:MAG: hypothetical protein NW204_04100 [Xanthomonadaceae bacterium]|nr:hypothetical protein [Xanthomonadaceae bacterium]
MTSPSLRLLGLLVVALLALWLLLAGGDRVLGLDTGKLGFAALVTLAWGSLYAVYRLPRGEADAAIAPGEWQAWIGLVFMAQLLAYLLLKSDVLIHAPVLHNVQARTVGNHVVMLFVAWLVISQLMKARWQDKVQEDERDREIARVAASWSSGALTFCVIGVAVTLGLSPAEKMAWATPPAIAHMLVYALLWAGLISHAAAAIQYWRDRH